MKSVFSVASRCDDCLRHGFQLRYKAITTEEAANQKDLDHNKPLLLTYDVKHF